jgi:hypothetical protein
MEQWFVRGAFVEMSLTIHRRGAWTAHGDGTFDMQRATERRRGRAVENAGNRLSEGSCRWLDATRER